LRFTNKDLTEGREFCIIKTKMGLTKITSDLQVDEGFEPKVYKDKLGIDTIGYGFTIRDLVLDRDIANAILMRKVLALQKDISEQMPWTKNLPDQVLDAVTEMCYQMGIGFEGGIHGFKSFPSAIAHLQKGEWAQAADDFLNSLWFKQTPERAKKVTDMIRDYHA
jgi:lysozyme